MCQHQKSELERVDDVLRIPLLDAFREIVRDARAVGSGELSQADAIALISDYADEFMAKAAVRVRAYD